MGIRNFTVSLFVPVLSVLTGCGEPDPAPSDEVMILNFRNNRNVFEEIRRDACELALEIGEEAGGSKYLTVMMDPSWSRPEVSNDIVQKYYAIFRKINAKGIQLSVSEDHCKIWVEYWSEGLAGGGDYKKFIHEEPNKLDIIVKSLYGLKLGAQIASYKRELEGGWWLAYDHYP
ncbi:hypothetical protein [Radicibacter daui]|uniref:hypothetical protein n=1 Tax=Radicibacter daui TaxID=3064829 RepID=UPI004046F27F